MHYFRHGFSLKNLFQKKNKASKPTPSTGLSSLAAPLSLASGPFDAALQEHTPQALLLLAEAPTAVDIPLERRAAYRISTSLAGQLDWGGPTQTAIEGMVSNLSGGGVQILLPSQPTTSRLTLSLKIPQAFVTTWLRQRSQQDAGSYEQREEQRQKIHGLFEQISGRVVHVGPSLAEASSLFQLSIAFDQPHEGCYRLVRYLERRTIQRVRQPQRRRPVAAAA